MNVITPNLQHFPCSVSLPSLSRHARQYPGIYYGALYYQTRTDIKSSLAYKKCQFSAHHDRFPVVGCRQQRAAVGRSSSSCISGNGAIAQLGTARYATANCWLLLCPSTQTTPTGASPPAQTGSNSPGSLLTKQP